MTETNECICDKKVSGEHYVRDEDGKKKRRAQCTMIKSPGVQQHDRGIVQDSHELTLTMSFITKECLKPTVQCGEGIRFQDPKWELAPQERWLDS